MMITRYNEIRQFAIAFYIELHRMPLLIRPVGQAVKTPPFHGGFTGSNPVRVTITFLKNVLLRKTFLFTDVF